MLNIHFKYTTLKTHRQRLSNLFLKLQLDIKTQIKIQNFKPIYKHTYKLMLYPNLDI